MKGDFTRDTFNPFMHFTRVLMQQGRVQLDADWNEQADIFLHYARTLANDLIGPHGGPEDNLGFKIGLPKTNNKNNQDFTISRGNYYVNGLLCENSRETSYYEQEDYPLSSDDKLKSGSMYLVLLDVWERHVTYLESWKTGRPGIREVALGGPDTATRAKLARQVKTVRLLGLPTDNAPLSDVEEYLATLMLILTSGKLSVQARTEQPTTEPCEIPPEAQYRGRENLLYRVEVHRSGVTRKVPKPPADSKCATFKWSRLNGSAIFPVVSLEGDVVTLRNLGRDSRFGLKVGDWVELVDDVSVLHNAPNRLLKIQAIDALKMQVTVTPSTPGITLDLNRHPIMRRWDHNGSLSKYAELEGAKEIVEGVPIELEDGIVITFAPAEALPPHLYMAGDYWIAPARTATHDVEWPAGSNGDPLPLRPHGVKHYYAPLAVITTDGDGKVVGVVNSLQRTFGRLGKP